MAFADDVAIKAAALEARAAALNEGVRQAAMQAMNPPPQAEYDTAALLSRIDDLESTANTLQSTVSSLQTTVSNLSSSLSDYVTTSTYNAHYHLWQSGTAGNNHPTLDEGDPIYSSTSGPQSS